jgi:hypothetical protein
MMFNGFVVGLPAPFVEVSLGAELFPMNLVYSLNIPTAVDTIHLPYRILSSTTQILEAP